MKTRIGMCDVILFLVGFSLEVKFDKSDNKFRR